MPLVGAKRRNRCLPWASTAAHAAAREPLRPAVQAMARLGREDLPRHPPLQDRADPHGGVVDRVPLGHTLKIGWVEMSEPEPRARSASRSGRPRRREISGVRYTSVVGAGSFGTALAVLLVRAGLRVTLHTRSPEQAGAAAERAREQALPARGGAAGAAVASSPRWRTSTGRTSCSWQCPPPRSRR